MNLLETVIQVLSNPGNEINNDFLTENQVSPETIREINAIQQVVAEHQVFQSEQYQLQLQSGTETFQLITKLKASLEHSLVESSNVQTIIKVMFSLTFILGFILIGVAIYFGWKGETFLATAFGGFGMLSIVTLLLKDPPLKIQDSRSNYAQLSLGILAWLNDLIDKGAMAQQNQIVNTLFLQAEDKTLEQKMAAHKEGIQNYLALSDTQINNTIKLLKLIDQVAEPSKKASFSLDDLDKAQRKVTPKE